MVRKEAILHYAEINDHLPDEVSESEQVEGIIGIINDMGIMVYDEAPDAEALLMSDAPAPVTDEEAAEEAEQALATVDQNLEEQQIQFECICEKWVLLIY